MTRNELRQKYGQRAIDVFYARMHAMKRDADANLCHLVRSVPVEQGEGVATQYTLITLTDQSVLGYRDASETPIERMKRVYRDWAEVGQSIPDLPELTVFTITEPLNLR